MLLDVIFQSNPLMVCEGYNSQSQIQSQSYLLMYHAFSAAKERHRTKLRPPHRLERGKVRGAPPAIYHYTKLSKNLEYKHVLSSRPLRPNTF